MVDYKVDGNTISMSYNDEEVVLEPGDLVEGEEDHYFLGKLKEITEGVQRSPHNVIFEAVFVDDEEEERQDRHVITAGGLVGQFRRGELEVVSEEEAELSL